jgi:uncharacterized protein (DUF305 family)
MNQFTIGLSLGLAISALGLAAQETGDDAMAGHDMAAMAAPGEMTPASLAFEAANDAMMSDMAITYTGDADIDFVMGMIGHHRGAVAMAQVVLDFGIDPEVRALAEGIIAAQEAEIAWMEAWLAAHPTPVE